MLLSPFGIQEGNCSTEWPSAFKKSSQQIKNNGAWELCGNGSFIPSELRGGHCTHHGALGRQLSWEPKVIIMSTVFSMRQESMEVIGENQTVDLNSQKKKKKVLGPRHAKEQSTGKSTEECKVPGVQISQSTSPWSPARLHTSALGSSYVSQAPCQSPV